MANNAKLALLRAKIDGQIQDLFIKTSFEHVIDSNNVALSTIIEGINTNIGNLDTNKANKSDLGTLAAKNEVSEAELSASLATLISSKAAQADLNALQQTVDNLGALGKKDKIEFSDLAEALQTLINAKAEASALQAEVERATAAEEANAAAIKAISDDYLKAADKTELSNAIKAVSDDYLKAADKTELSNAIAAEKERAEGVEAGLQTQINTIMNNPDTEGVINSINEFTQYVADHGEIAEGFRTSIAANAQAIEDLEVCVGEIPRTRDIISEITVQPNGEDRQTIAFNEKLVYDEEYTVVLDDQWYYGCKATNYGPNDIALFVGGTYYADSQVILSCNPMNIANSTIIMEQADQTAPHTVRVIKYGSDAENIVAYIDEKVAPVESNVKYLQEDVRYLQETTEKLVETIGVIPKKLDIVPETTFNPNGNDTTRLAYADELVTGEKYTIVFDGVQYNDCVAYGSGVDVWVVATTTDGGTVDVTKDYSTDNTLRVYLGDGIDTSVEHTIYVFKPGVEGVDTVVDYIDVKTAAVEDSIAALGALAQKDVVSESDLDADLAAKVNASAQANHSHDNKELLDTYTQTEADLADAVAKKHAHENADVLNGITADHVASWANIATNTQAIAALNIKPNVYTATPADDEIAEGQMFIQLV